MRPIVSCDNEVGLDMAQYIQSEISSGLFPNTEKETIPELSTMEIQHCHTLLQQEADIVHPRDILGPVEYIAFLSKMNQAAIGPTANANIPEQFAYLPEELKTNFEHSSCNCPPTNPGCCVDVRGVYVGHGSDLDKICENTLLAFEGHDKQ